MREVGHSAPDRALGELNWSMRVIVVFVYRLDGKLHVEGSTVELGRSR